MMLGRRTVYNLIYLGVLIAVPEVPLAGIKFLVLFFSGMKKEYTAELGHVWKHHAKDIIFDVHGPVWHMFH